MANWRIFAVWTGLVAVLLRTILIYFVGATTPDYSPISNFISELSAEGMPFQLLMNYVSLIFFGIAVFISSFGLWSYLPGSWVKSAAVLTAISGLSYMMIGLLPCSPGCDLEVYPLRMRGHMLAALIATCTSVLAALSYGIGVIRKAQPDGLRRFSLVVGLIGIIAFLALWVYVIFYFQGIDLGYAGIRGLLQRVNATSGDLWLVGAYVWILFSKVK